MIAGGMQFDTTTTTRSDADLGHDNMISANCQPAFRCDLFVDLLASGNKTSRSWSRLDVRKEDIGVFHH